MSRTTPFGRAGAGHLQRASRKGRWPVPEFCLAAIAIGALAYVAIARGLVSVPLTNAPSVTTNAPIEVIDRYFPLCSGAGGTCVIDGDTIRLDGVSIRVADIDTPEIRNYACSAELALGRQASERMAALLNDGPFVIVPYSRDEDVYGRKLRILERDGQSLGTMLVAEGLARAWDGARHPWCG